MGDNFKKVQTGQPLKIPAETFNAFLDAARDFRSRQQSRESQSEPSFRQSGIVKVKNGSGEDRNRFEILGIDRPIFTPTDNLDTFQNDVLLIGVMPDGEDHPGRFCVLLEPLKADAIGLAVISGVCPVRIDVQEESDTFAEVQDDDATQLKSGGSGSVTILWKQSGTGENKWAVVRLGDSQPVIRKAEMIDTLRQGDTDPAKAWLLKYEDDDWQRTDKQIDLYGDKGFRGVAFGKTEEVDSGDKIDVYYSHEAKQWYGVVGGWYFHGDVVDDIAEGDQGEVKLNVGAGSDAREITVPAFSPYSAVKKDDFVSVNWNTFSVHWDIGKFQGAEPGCGLDRDEDPESPDYGKLRVKVGELAGCGLKTNTEGEACQIEVDAATVAGPGLMPVGECSLAVQITAGCGIEVTEGTEVAVKADDLAKSGLKTEGDCGLAVNPGCGIWINAGKVEVAHDELAGDGLVIGDNCEIDVDCNWIKTQCVKPGCGIWWNGDKLEVAHDELAGNGLVIGSNCAIDVDCNWIKTDCVKPGCGLWWNGDLLEVAHDELAGDGLVIGNNCAIDVDCNWIKTNCITCQVIRDCVIPGCGIWWNGNQLEVAHDELAGNGLVIGSNCAIDVDCSWIKSECVKPGCGLWWNGDKLEVAHDEIAGNGLVIGSDCAIDVDCNWIKTVCVKPGCGIWWNGDLLEVAHDELAGNGLVIGNGCAIDVDCTWIKTNCVKPGCGLWWNGDKLEVAHDELAGNGLVIGNNCTLDVDCNWIKANCNSLPMAGCGIFIQNSDDGTVISVSHDELTGKGLVIGSDCSIDVALGCGLKFDGNEAIEVKAEDLAGSGLLPDTGCALKVDWSQAPLGCGLWWNGTQFAVSHDELAGKGLTLGGGECSLDVAIGCGLKFDGNEAIEVKASDLAGSGLAVDTGCALKVDWTQVPLGCGLWWDGSNVAVAHDELAGKGLSIGSGQCELEVALGCGLQFGAGDAVEVKSADLAGSGLVTDGPCALKVDWSEAPVGCGLWWDGSTISVSHDELPGKGLTIGSGQCSLDVSLGCGLKFGAGDAVEVNASDLAGSGLATDSNCALKVDWGQAPVGCGLWWNGSALAVAHDELCGPGLVPTGGCELAIDCAWIAANCTGNQGPQGDQGPQGPEGAQGYGGAQGPQGAQGYQGDVGSCPTVTASATCVGAGQSCGVSVTQTGCDASFSFTLAQGDQGNQGYQGDQGAQGAQGFQGQQGAQGAQGASGSQGPQGFQGYQGSQGYQGAQGFQGTQGYQGSQGVDGSQGLQGDQGSQGAQGVAGSVGPPGPQGAQGSQGTQGAPGAQGPQGAVGSTGAQGSQGAAGEQGATGSQGVQGAAGTQGSQGAQGAQGNAGSQGTQGSQGATGPQGDQGNVGAQGVPGADGPMGPTGPQGATGAQGMAGAQGPQGFQGAVGAQGTEGAVGAQGQLGATGPQGIQGAAGANGQQGVQGAAGEPGAQGPQGVVGAPGPQGSQGAVGAPGPQGLQGSVGQQGLQGTMGDAGPQGAQGSDGP